MSSIILKAKHRDDFTMISNCFIDQYMPEAPGNYVKLYLYLVRQSYTDLELSMEALADTFICNEGDLIRGMRYWQNRNLLHLEVNENNEIVSIELQTCKPNPSYKKPVDTTDLTKTVKNVKNVLSKERRAADNLSSIQVEEPENTRIDIKVDKQIPAPERPSYSPDDISRLNEEKTVQTILYVAETMLERNLTSTDTNWLLYFYDQLGFDEDLITYLIDYCLENSHSNINYIKSVALAWAKDGIKTEEEAKHKVEENRLFNKNIYPIMKALGINNRNPATEEEEYIKRWTSDYCFPMNIIIEACNKTIQAISKPSFKYADSILNRWKKLGVANLEDIKKLDAEHAKNVSKKVTQTSSVINIKPNAFANFDQREQDMDELEKKLLANRK